MQDEDLTLLNKSELIREVIKLRNGIREHRDCSGHDLCWYHPKLWGLLPEKTVHQKSIPDWPEFMNGCVKYRTSLEKRQLKKLRQG